MNDDMGRPLEPGSPLAPGGPLDRVARGIGGMNVVRRLAGLSGSDFASLMLEVVRRRAARETPASVLRRYARDRFVRPGGTPWRSTRRAEDILLGCLPANVDLVTLAPLVPLGTHSALGTVSQHKIVTTIRACEVVADPTNALALEAAARRAGPAQGGSAQSSPAQGRVCLAAIHRVVRAQRFPAGWSAHFGLFAMVTAGRDEGDRRFERSVLAEHLRFAVAGLRAAGLARVQAALTPLSDAGERIAASVAEELAEVPAEIVTDHARTAGRGYYLDVCFKVNVLVDGVPVEIGDGGFTDWTAKLLASKKERLLISGYGLDRLAALVDDALVDDALVDDEPSRD
jgi:hypothetical protein